MPVMNSLTNIGYKLGHVVLALLAVNGHNIMLKFVIPATLCGKSSTFVKINSSDYCIMNDNFAIQLFEGTLVENNCVI